MAWKPATPQLELVFSAGSASQFHPTVVERPTRSARRSGSLIRQALYLDQEDAYAERGELAKQFQEAFPRGRHGAVCASTCSASARWRQSGGVRSSARRASDRAAARSPNA